MPTPWRAPYGGECRNSDSSWRRFLLVCAVHLTFAASGFATTGKLYPVNSPGNDYYHLQDDFIEFGLSDRQVSTFLRDSKGFLWIGTDGGLNKFDGYEFRVFRSDRRDPYSISANGIIVLHEDREGTIWIGTNDGKLNRFDRRSERCTIYSPDSTSIAGPGKSSIAVIHDDADAGLWLCTTSGQIYIFDKTKGHFERVDQKLSKIWRTAESGAPCMQCTRVHKIVKDPSGLLWFATSEGLYSYDSRLQTGRRHELISADSRTTDPSQISNKYVNDMLLDDQRGLLVALNKEIWQLDLKTHQAKLLLTLPQYPFTGFRARHRIHHFVKDLRNRLWISVFNLGLIRYDLSNGSTQHYDTNSETKIGWMNEMILNLLYDPQGILWVGGRSGLCKIDLKPLRFSSESNLDVGVERTSPWYVRSLLLDKNNSLWVGTDVGVRTSRMKDDRPTVSHYKLAEENDRYYPVNAISQDSSGLIWMACSYSQLTSYNPDDGSVRYYDHERRGMGSMKDGVYSLLTDRRGVLWIGTSYGLQRYDAASDSFAKYFRPDSTRTNIRRFVFSIFEYDRDLLWLGTNEGIKIFNRASEQFVKTYIHDPHDSSSISSNAVWCINADESGTIWAAAFGHGLNRYIKNTDSFQRFTESDGLASNSVFGILPDRNGHLWLSTNKGITRLNLSTLEFRNYDKSDGLGIDEFYFGAYHRHHPSGELFVGGLEGYVHFHPDNVKDNPHIPPVVITELRVFDRPRQRELFNGDTVRLSYRDNFISFRFAALDYTNPSKHQYSYILDGIDPQWVNSGTRRYAAYTDLAGGTYTFRVKGSNNDGVWNTEGIAITLIIDPAWWTTMGFRSAVFAALFGLAFAFVRFRFRSEQRKAALQRKVLESELEALRLQMNPHFLFNSLCSIQHFILQHNANTAYDYLARFAHLMRMVVENSKREEIALAQELQILELYLELENLRFEDRLSYSIVIDSTIDPQDQMIPPMLLQPYVENAIVHGLRNRDSGGRISIVVRASGDSVIYTIEDNGVGRVRAQELQQKRSANHLSIGMKVARDRLKIMSEKMQQRMQIHVTDLYDQLGNAAGTRVEIMLATQHS